MARSLYDFAFFDKLTRWRVYRVIMLLGFLYGVVNDAVLKRPTKQVTIEMFLVMAALTLGYIIVRLVLHKKVQVANRPQGLGRYPQLLLVVVAITVAINVFGAEKWERAAVNKRILHMLSEPTIDFMQASALFHSAEVLRLRSDAAVRSRAASALLQSASRSGDNQPAAWETVMWLANYQSALSTADSVVKRVESEASNLGIPKPVFSVLLWKETNVGEVTITGMEISGAASTTIPGKTVPGSISAILAPIGSEPSRHPKEGPGYVIFGAFPAGGIHDESAHITIPIDGLHCRNIVFRRCRIIYRGGPVTLDNVAFENCSFEFGMDDDSKRLIARFVGSSTLDFSAN